MIKLEYPIIVEGKYDKIKLSNFIDSLIITTNGFSIFKDIERRRMIKDLENKCGGIIVLTDSDSAGNLIRAHLKNILGENANIINVYIPCIKGKEKRKTKESKEGFLGVEGISEQDILNALAKSGLHNHNNVRLGRKITKTDLYEFSLSGKSDSVALRKGLLNYLKLPPSLSPNAMLDILNTYYTFEEFCKVVEKWQNEDLKN